MCGTTWVEYSCGHSSVQARSGPLCAIGHAAGAARHIRQHCWEHPQGIEKTEGLCGACRFRQQKYGNPDPAAAMQRMRLTLAGLKKSPSTAANKAPDAEQGTSKPGPSRE